MPGNLGRKLAVSTMSAALLCGMAGSIAGTLAWYQYSTRATLGYNGTSIGQSQMLQIGIQSDVDFTSNLVDTLGNPIDLGLTKETIGGKDYYFAASGSGLGEKAISAYIGKMGQAVNRNLQPLSTHSYAKGDDFKLYRALISGYPNSSKEAPISAYCSLPLAFRVSYASKEGYVGNASIWLTDAVATSLDGHSIIHNGLRIHVDGAGNKFILNPSLGKDGEAGATKVAGLLDLNKDGYYDHKDGQEIIYGDYLGSATPVAYETDSLLDDVNKTGGNVRTTFLSRHKAGVKGYASSSPFVTPLEAEYETLKSIAPLDDEGSLSGGMPIAITGSGDNPIGEATISIYMEGWDFSVIDSQVGKGFDLALQFQINKES